MSGKEMSYSSRPPTLIIKLSAHRHCCTESCQAHIHILQGNKLFTKSLSINSLVPYASVKHTIIGSDNGLSPVRQQAIIWTNAAILSIRPIGTYFSEILFKIKKFSFKEMHLKMSSAEWRPFCLSLNVLILCQYTHYMHKSLSSKTNVPENLNVQAVKTQNITSHH